MKKFCQIFASGIILCLLLIIPGCVQKDEPQCGSYKTAKWDNIQPAFLEYDAISGVGRFLYTCDITNICIESLADIQISLTEKTGSHLSRINAFSIVPNSSSPSIIFYTGRQYMDQRLRIEPETGF